MSNNFRFKLPISVSSISVETVQYQGDEDGMITVPAARMTAEMVRKLTDMHVLGRDTATGLDAASKLQGELLIAERNALIKRFHDTGRKPDQRLSNAELVRVLAGEQVEPPPAPEQSVVQPVDGLVRLPGGGFVRPISGGLASRVSAALNPPPPPPVPPAVVVGHQTTTPLPPAVPPLETMPANAGDVGPEDPQRAVREGLAGRHEAVERVSAGSPHPALAKADAGDAALAKGPSKATLIERLKARGDRVDTSKSVAQLTEQLMNPQTVAA